jgi:hypothetical protein
MTPSIYGTSQLSPIKEIRLKIIPHSHQRYNTVGDYIEREPGVWDVYVSDTGDWREAVAVFLHEVVELALTTSRGIPEPVIREFDEAFESNNKDPDSEPGDAPTAPYRKEHRFSENIERQFVAEMGIHWDDYENHIMRVWRHEKNK